MTARLAQKEVFFSAALDNTTISWHFTWTDFLRWMDLSCFSGRSSKFRADGAEDGWPQRSPGEVAGLIPFSPAP